MTTHYVLEVSLKEVTHATQYPATTTYRGSGDRAPAPVKVEREVNERFKFIATTDTLGEALSRVTDWAASEKKYIAEAKDVEVRSR